MRNLFYLSRFILCSLALGLFFSCDDDGKVSDPGSSNTGVFILNQGLESMNDATISFLDLTEESDTYIEDITNGSLGDTGQDMIIYGSKLYVSVSGSNYIQVFDAVNKNRVRTIDVKKDGQSPSMPRSLASYEGKVYATTMDGYVIRIDTLSYNIEAWTEVGPNPEGIAAVKVNGKGKLYVANSDGYNWENDYANGKSVSVVDIETFKEDANRITVGLNPAVLHADMYGNVYVICNGNYFDILASFVKIDTKTNQTQVIEDIQPYNFTINGKYCYFYNSVYTSSTSLAVGVYDVEAQRLVTDDFITDDTSLTNPYGIGVDPYTGDVYVGDSPEYGLPGKVYIFNKEGKCNRTLPSRINPCVFAFYRYIE